MGPPVDIPLKGFTFGEGVTTDDSYSLAPGRWGGWVPWDDQGGLNADRVSVTRAGRVAVSALTLIYLDRGCDL